MFVFYFCVFFPVRYTINLYLKPFRNWKVQKIEKCQCPRLMSETKLLECEVNGMKGTFHSPNSSRSKKLLTSSAASSLEAIKENTNYLARNVRKCNVSNGWSSYLTLLKHSLNIVVLHERKYLTAICKVRDSIVISNIINEKFAITLYEAFIKVLYHWIINWIINYWSFYLSFMLTLLLSNICQDLLKHLLYARLLFK